jgi:ABC-type Fe3+ transport system permease subunit
MSNNLLIFGWLLNVHTKLYQTWRDHVDFDTSVLFIIQLLEITAAPASLSSRSYLRKPASETTIRTMRYKIDRLRESNRPLGLQPDFIFLSVFIVLLTNTHL